MEREELVQVLEALLFASGKPVKVSLLSEILDVEKKEVTDSLEELRQKLIERNSGIQLIKVNDSYQLATLEKYYTYICELLDNRPKPNLSQAAFEVLSIIAYNPGFTRAEIEKIRGVSSDSALNKLIEYGIVEEAGRMNAPGRPMMYKTTEEFLKLFGYSSIEDLPELPTVKEALGETEEVKKAEETVEEKADEKELDEEIEKEETAKKELDEELEKLSNEDSKTQENMNE